MTKKEAINLLEQVCAAYRGTLEEHRKLQEALEAIKLLAEEEKKPKEK
jgi:hypothetical protein